MPLVIALFLCLWLGAVPGQAQSGPSPRNDLGQLSASGRWIVQ